MLASISPLGERARNNRWWLTVSAYALASTAAGAAVGAAAGGLGSALGAGARSGSARSWLLAAGAAACLLAAAWDLRGRTLPPRRQVNEDWLGTYRGWVYGAGFGAQLGAGFATIVTSATVPLTFFLALLTGGAGPGGLVGATFGLVRALPVTALARTRSAEDLRRFHRRMHGAARPVRRVTVAGALAVGAALVLGAVGAGGGVG